MKKKGKSKWFSPMSAAKFYISLMMGILLFAHAFNGFLTKPMDEIFDFNLMSLSPIMTLVLCIVAFSFAQNTYRNQRW